MSVAESLEPIAVTVTFLEMKKPPANYAHVPMNRNVALIKTRRHAAALLPLPDGSRRPQMALGEHPSGLSDDELCRQDPRDRAAT